MEGYADGSWTPARQLYAVAALIAPAQAWAALQTPWSQVLRRADPKLEIFHRADLYSQYVEPYCRWDDAKRARVLAELTRLLAGTAKYAVAGVLLKDEYDSFCGRHGRPLGATPYELCADTCIGFVSKWLEANDLGSERVAYFFEAGDREHGGSGQFSDSIQRIIRRFAQYREEMRIASASFVPKRALSANMRETVTSLKSNVEGDQGLEVDERDREGSGSIGGGGRGEGDAAAVHAGVQAQDPARGGRL